MLKIGQNNTLNILRGTSVGFFLGDEEGNDVLLPHKYIPEGAEVGQSIDVFLYRDSEDRVIATTLTPLVKAGEFACLEVAAVSNVGAFLEIGLEKHLLVPFRNQNGRLNPGDYVVAYVYLDEATDRLVGATKFNKYFDKDYSDLAEGQQVEVLLYENTELGFNVIVNNKYKGLIYKNEIFNRVAWGEKTTAWIKKIRDDEKLDLSLQPIGFLNTIEPNAQKILDTLMVNNGFLALNDNSDPLAVQEILEMSKKAFKKALGNLYKQKKVSLEADGIRLVQD